eukprot:1328969-Rhodomonas_salina.1
MAVVLTTTPNKGKSYADLLLVLPGYPGTRPRPPAPAAATAAATATVLLVRSRNPRREQYKTDAFYQYRSTALYCQRPVRVRPVTECRPARSPNLNAQLRPTRRASRARRSLALLPVATGSGPVVTTQRAMVTTQSQSHVTVQSEAEH